jgi:hypothetical protein
MLGNQAQSAWRVANDRIAEEQNASQVARDRVVRGVK